MNFIKEFMEYLLQFNPISKRIVKITLAIAFVLYILSMYFAMSAGVETDYYKSMEIFKILTENAKGILAVGFFVSLLLEPIYKAEVQ